MYGACSKCTPLYSLCTPYFLLYNCTVLAYRTIILYCTILQLYICVHCGKLLIRVRRLCNKVIYLFAQLCMFRKLYTTRIVQF